MLDFHKQVPLAPATGIPKFYLMRSIAKPVVAPAPAPLLGPKPYPYFSIFDIYIKIYKHSTQ